MDSTPNQSITNPEKPSEADTRLSSAWLVLARVARIVVVALALGLFVVSIPAYFVYLHGLSSQSPTDSGLLLSAADVRQLQAMGLSIDFYAWYNVVLNILFVLSFVLVGIAIFWRRSDDRMALLAAFTLVMFSPERH